MIYQYQGSMWKYFKYNFLNYGSKYSKLWSLFGFGAKKNLGKLD